jgi:hypothetical protein
VALPDRVRAGCAAVMQRARFVRIDEAALERLAGRLAGAGSEPPAPALDPAHHHVGSPQDTLAFVITLDAVNFGSGWFPHLKKRPGLSGYFTVARSLKEQFEREGPWRAEALVRLTAEDCARVFGQDLRVPEQAELMELFARAWNELGAFLSARYAGRFAGPLAEAEGSAEGIAAILATLSFYRDVSRYEELEVPFFKRAQLTVADLAAAPIGEQGERLHGLERLTIFADNLVPHVLRSEGVLHYEASLAARIEREELIPAGSPEEIEIRAAGVHAVETLVARLAERGVATTARALDSWLWNRGQSPAIKARPRHRTRTVYY